MVVKCSKPENMNLKKTALLSVVVITLCAFSCEHVECGCEAPPSACDTNDPVSHFQWLIDMKNSFTNCECQMSIMKGKYQNQTVFYALMNDPLCNGAQSIVLLSCRGEEIKTFESLAAAGDDLKPEGAIYTCTE